MEKSIDEKEAEITELKSKLLEVRKAQHVGCDDTIQKLKSTIVDL